MHVFEKALRFLLAIGAVVAETAEAFAFAGLSPVRPSSTLQTLFIVSGSEVGGVGEDRGRRYLTKPDEDDSEPATDTNRRGVGTSMTSVASTTSAYFDVISTRRPSAVFWRQTNEREQSDSVVSSQT